MTINEIIVDLDKFFKVVQALEDQLKDIFINNNEMFSSNEDSDIIKIILERACSARGLTSALKNDIGVIMSTIALVENIQDFNNSDKTLSRFSKHFKKYKPYFNE